MNTITTEYHDIVPHLRRAMDESDYPTVGIEPPCPSLLAQCELDSLRAELQHIRGEIAKIAAGESGATKAKLESLL
jgi:hypothetical protein